MTQQGAIYSIGYNAWKGGQGLSNMFDALESEGVTILIDTRNSDYQSKYSYDQLGQEAASRTGMDGKPMRFASRPALSGKPRTEDEYNEAGQADYRVMNERPEAKRMLDGMAAAAQSGERIALLCACADVHTCHRTRWLSRSLSRRGVDVGHIEPGEFDPERNREEGVKELYQITRHSDLPELPPHSDLNWREQAAKYAKPEEPAAPVPAPKGYHSPESTRSLPEHPSQILIAGSMKANNAQLNYAAALVIRAAEINAQIHVGDNPKGVDARVVETANTLGYENVVVWTAGDEPRNGGVEGGQIRKVPHNPYDPRGGNRFTQRDRTMIGALHDEFGAAFFIDNGFTHHRNGHITGTEAGYAYAVEQGKAARKVSLGRQQDREAELQPLPERAEQSAYSFHLLPDEIGTFTAVALRDTFRQSEQITARHLLELRRFDQRDEAGEYLTSLEDYMREKKGMTLSGAQEQIVEAASFLQQVAQKNGLEGQERLVQRDDLLQKELSHTYHDLTTQPIQIPDEAPSL
jgi:hypothetical protein